VSLLTEKEGIFKISPLELGAFSWQTQTASLFIMIWHKRRLKLFRSGQTFQSGGQQFAQARLDGKYDCHRALASEMFKVPYDEVPVKDWDEDNHPTIRYVAKRCRHGLNYRMERFKLSEVTDLPYHKSGGRIHALPQDHARIDEVVGAGGS